MVLTFEFDLDRVNKKLHAKYSGQISLRLKAIVRMYTLTHAANQLFNLDR